MIEFIADWLIANPLFCWCMHINRQKRQVHARAWAFFIGDCHGGYQQLRHERINRKTAAFC